MELARTIFTWQDSFKKNKYSSWSKMLFKVLLALGCVCYLPTQTLAQCSNLEFEDGVLGTLIPCPWPNARGMLCMKDALDTVIWPGVEESEAMASCGITMPTSSREKRDTAAILDCMQRSGSTEGCGLKKRKKRQFTLNKPKLTSEKFRRTKYDFRQILKELVRAEWGLERKEQIDPTIQAWIENNVTLSRDEETGIYRALVT
jgi:hypothetical protein